MYGSFSRSGSNRSVTETQDIAASVARQGTRNSSRLTDNSPDGIVSADLVRLDHNAVESQLFNRSPSVRCARSTRELLPVAVSDAPASRANTKASRPVAVPGGSYRPVPAVVSAKGTREKRDSYAAFAVPIAGTWTGVSVAAVESARGSVELEARRRSALHVKPSLAVPKTDRMVNSVQL